jgi:hypothetical protein
MKAKIRYNADTTGPGARVVELIRTELEVRGAGTKDDPARRVTQLWDFDGNLVAEYDINDTLGCNVTGHRIKPGATLCMHCGANFKEPAP